ncbi:MAG TPA: hypothetical protein VJN18_14760 [Polyangiaceae bacterium]|nr:hypothetical protein [Polyangiaceae bacterium]
MATRKRKGPAKAGPKPASTIEIGPDFIGLKDADGKVLVDDTAYFRSQEMQRPIWEALRKEPRYRELEARFDKATDRVQETDEELSRELGLVHYWIEQYIVVTCGLMLEEAKHGH